MPSKTAATAQKQGTSFEYERSRLPDITNLLEYKLGAASVATDKG